MIYADYSDDEVRNQFLLADADAIEEVQRRYGHGLIGLLRARGVADPDRGLQLALLEALTADKSQGTLWEILRNAAVKVATG